ncbi:hypothetical protein Thiowin_03458 [Thiorhodovibrio winogradskyi]|uniref:TRASH domain-containing protein n=1 Tax=Thiorhodovibrio winogradskyi TaxID=77007 RepID=A0ABZ0SE55_9GAMM|nr:DUF3330 domain-containing protein [Thiorhodovibrio winogradskyi]
MNHNPTDHNPTDHSPIDQSPIDQHPGQASHWPHTLHCEQCQREIPPDEALHPEGQDYTLAFCSPGCHAVWRDREVEPVASSHRKHGGRDG